MTTTTLKKVIDDPDFNLFYNKINRFKLDVCDNLRVNAEFLEHTYKFLTESYRNEYVYKNIITNNLLNSTSFTKDAFVVLDEFKIGKSIADLIFINGINRVYEIKTELDSPDRLQGQLSDYRKMFSESYIVTHWTLENKYSNIINFEDTGLIILDSNLELKEVKPANKVTKYFDVETMFKCLRKKEMSNVVKRITGTLPECSNMVFFNECVNIVDTHTPEEVQREVLIELKKRNLRQVDSLLKDKTIPALKHLCLCLDFTEEEYNQLHKFLDSPFVR